MVRFLFGVTLGLVLGTAISASAVGTWYTAKTFLDRTDEFQNGYVAGASDALDSIVDVGASMDFLRTKAACLNTSDKVNRLGDFRAWAVRQMQNKGDYQAASVIISEACAP